jgi:hypothetical protein
MSDTMAFVWNTVWNESSDFGKMLMVGAYPFWMIGYLFCYIVVDPFVKVSKNNVKRLENVV